MFLYIECSFTTIVLKYVLKRALIASSICMLRISRMLKPSICVTCMSEEGLFHGHFPGIIQSKGSSLPLALRLNKRLPGSSLLLRFDLPGARHASVHRLQPMERMAIEARPIGNRDQQCHHHSRKVHVHHCAIRRCEVAGEESH